MDVAAAYEVMGLPEDSTPADIDRTYRLLRKPLLKKLNQFDSEAQPPELVEELTALETAHKVLEAATADSAKQPEARDGSATGTGAAGTPARSTSGMKLEPGAVLLDRFEIKARISHRPEGDTYRVHDRVRDSDACLKVLYDGLVRDAGVRTRVKRSLLEASRLNHPRLVRVLDVVQLQHTLAVVQQLPVGENLWERLHGENATKEPLAAEFVSSLAEQCTQALAHLHRAMPHATLRPESIWIAEDGSVQISDFGFAEVRGPLRARRLSRSKLGTAYWAPEQYRDDLEAMDERSDQHSLALVLYEALSGKPTVGRTASIRSFRQDLPRRFTQAVERALSSKPLQRFDDMDAFGAAAFVSYRPAGAPPAAEASRTLLIPALVLLALVVGFAFSPPGRKLGDVVGEMARTWHAAEGREAQADLEWRQLNALGRRLHERGQELDKASREELGRIRAELAASVATASERMKLGDRLAQVVGQLVADSERRAEAALARAGTALDALGDWGPAQEEADSEARTDLARKLASAAPEERLAAALELVRHEAGVRSRSNRWEAEQVQVAAPTELASAYRSMREAWAALEIGNDVTTGKAYVAAATGLEAVAAAADASLVALKTAVPLRAEPGAPLPLEKAQLKTCLQVLLEPAARLTGDADLAQQLAGLQADAVAAANGHWLVHADGFWALGAEAGVREFVLAGTWRRVADAYRLRVTVLGDRPLERPYEMDARRGEDEPGVGDLVDALAAAPGDVRALWCARPGTAKALPTPAFAEGKRTVQAGELSVRGTLPPKTAGCVLVEGRRSEVSNGAFEARVSVPGDVLGTWLRVHAAQGLRSGPGAWMRVRTDGLKPRVHLLEPADRTAVDAGATVTVRFLVYDSNLTALEIGGEAESLRRDDVYVLKERTLTAPSAGELVLPVRAADAAGNQTLREWKWPVK